MGAAIEFVLLVGWLAGFILADGVVSTFFCIIPFWAWYLSLERLLMIWGFV